MLRSSIGADMIAPRDRDGLVADCLCALAKICSSLAMGRWRVVLGAWRPGANKPPLKAVDFPHESRAHRIFAQGCLVPLLPLQNYANLRFSRRQRYYRLWTDQDEIRFMCLGWILS